MTFINDLVSDYVHEAHVSAIKHMAILSASVAVTPGSAFGPSGENHVRMAYCVDEDTINLAFDRIEAYFANR